MKYKLPLLLAMILLISVQFAKSQVAGTGNTLNTAGTGITAIQSNTATSYKLVVGGAVKIFGPTSASTAGAPGSPTLILGNNFTGTGIKYGLFSSDAGHFIIYDSVANLTRFVISKLGKIGIGLLGAASAPTLPDSTLHVNGGFKLVNGSQGANKILVSDASGGASWQLVSGDLTDASSSGSLVSTIGANKVTYAKIQAASLAGRLLGSPSTGTAISELKLGTGLIISNDSLKLTSPGGTGTVSSVSVTSANGFSGTVATPTTTPAISIGTSVTGLLKGNGTAVSAAVSGTDFSAGTNALATGIIKSTTSTGALSIAVAADFPILNQNTTGTAANVTGVVGIANGGTGQTSSSGSLNALLPVQTGNANKVLQSDGTNATWVGPTPALVSSVFGRTGAIVAAINDYTFAQLASKPTTLAGYGITDAAALSHTHNFSSLTDFTIGTPVTGQVLTYNGTKWINQAPAGGGTGTVTSVSLVAANGFSGSVATPTTTPAITVTTSVTGLLKGNGVSISPATAGTDFSAGTNALVTGILKSTTATGALSIAVAGDFPALNQNTTGTAGNVTGVVAIPNGGTGQITATGALNALLPLQTGNASKVLQTDGANATWITPLANAVSSVFGRTGVVVAAANDYSFAQLASKPTTLAGYGITDAAALNHTHSFSTLTDFTVATPANGQVLTYNGTKWVNQYPSGGLGTVTSVGLTMPAGFTVTGSPITTNGTLAVTTSLNGLIKGSSGSFVPAVSGTDFSAGTNALATGILKSTTATGALSIAVAGDFPVFNQNTTGTAGNVTGVVAISNGGTGQTTATGALNALLPTQSGNATKVLQSDGTNASWIAPPSSPVTSVFGRTGAVVSAANDYTFAQLANTPTTLAGYGITDAAALNHTHSFSTLNDFTVSAPATGQILTYNGTKWVNQAPAVGTNGTVTSVSVVASNGFIGTVANPTTTPAITISTSASGMLKGNGTAIAAATTGIDYSAGTSALATGILKSTNATGALSIAAAIDFPILNQNTTGTAGNITGILNAGSFPALTGDVTTTAGSLAATIAANAVSFGKIQQISSGTLLGRSSAATGNVESITIGNGLILSGGQLSATGNSGNTWNLNGNTVGSMNTIGTINNFDLPIITNNTEKLRITATGNVGIGVSTPGGKLDVNGDLISRGRILAGSTGFINGDALQVSGNALILGNISGVNRISNNNYTSYSYLDLPYFNNYGWTFFTPNAAGNAAIKRFEVGNSADIVNSTFTNSNVIISNGVLGIGTPTPNSNAKLDVSGNIFTNGLIAIGETNMTKIGSNSLVVNGTALFTKATVKLNTNWPDYVFNPSYKLLTISELEKFLAKNHHLPDVTTAAEIEKNGIDLGDNQTLLLKKVEELTLYLIELNKKVENLSKENQLLKKTISAPVQ